MFHWSCSVNSMSYHCIVFSIWYFFFLFISLQTVYTQDLCVYLFISLQTVYTQDLCVYFIYCVVLRRHTTVAHELTHGFLWGSCCSIFNVMFSLFVISLLVLFVIVLSVPWFTASNYSSGSFNRHGKSDDKKTSKHFISLGGLVLVLQFPFCWLRIWVPDLLVKLWNHSWSKEAKYWLVLEKDNFAFCMNYLWQ
jgi:hypothetical protein